MAYRLGGDSGELGVYLVGQDLVPALEPDRAEMCAQLPAGTQFRTFYKSDGVTCITKRRASEFSTQDEMRRWLIQTLNAYVNVLRPRIKSLEGERR